MNRHTTTPYRETIAQASASPSRTTVQSRQDRFGFFTGQDIAGVALATLMALGPLTTYAFFGS